MHVDYMCPHAAIYRQIYCYMDYRRHEVVANSSLISLLVSWPRKMFGTCRPQERILFLRAYRKKKFSSICVRGGWGVKCKSWERKWWEKTEKTLQPIVENVSASHFGIRFCFENYVLIPRLISLFPQQVEKQNRIPKSEGDTAVLYICKLDPQICGYERFYYCLCPHAPI
jgi:hypothetical protein